MKISENERRSADKLTLKFLEHKDKLPYANIGDDGNYAGWVTNFKLKDQNGDKIYLDLKNQEDQFLLFVLAVAWSRTGPWENAAFFIAHLKVSNKHAFEFWKDKCKVNLEKSSSRSSAHSIHTLVSGIEFRKKISFRKDIYDSVHILAIHWDKILEKLLQAERKSEFISFIEYIRSIDGLGTGRKKILIKIPLILRELRCQSIYLGIPGEHCCVPDKRVYEAAKELNISLPVSTSLPGLMKSSTKIYNLFGDLYDLPLFAYEDPMSFS